MSKRRTRGPGYRPLTVEECPSCRGYATIYCRSCFTYYCSDCWRLLNHERVCKS